MAFQPGHRGVVAIAAETGTITDSADGTTPDELPAIPSSPTLIGYTPSLPEGTKGLNNRKGYAIGAAGALYNSRGRIQPSLRIDLRPGSTGFLETYGTRTNDVLPYFAAFVGIGGVFTAVYRFCKINELTFNFPEGQQSGGEITAGAQIMALCTQELGSPIALNPSALRALGEPLQWHDIRSFNFGATSYRRALMGLNATVNHNLEYKGQRPNWGDDEPLARAAYELMEHHINARAEITFHERLNRNLFHGAVAAQDWDDITLSVNDIGATKQLNMTLESPFVSDETARGIASGEQASYTVPVELDGIAFDFAQSSGSGSGSGSGSS